MNSLTWPDESWFQRYGLRIVLAVAILLRLIAVIFSKGYMASDDHFQTITVAFGWLQHGLLDSTGHLTWQAVKSSDISRFPLYTLSVYAVMWLYKQAGSMSLDTMMYGVRAIHAAISLMGVWAVYQIVRIATRPP